MIPQQVKELKDENDTCRWAESLAPALPVPCTIALAGDLGMGKTHFARAVVRALAGDPALVVPSPTFGMVQTYSAPAGDIWHFDLYRLSHPDELREIGWECSALSIRLIEWPDRVPAALLGAHTRFIFEQGEGGPDARRVTVTHHE